VATVSQTEVQTEVQKAKEYAAMAWNSDRGTDVSQLYATLAQAHATIALAEAQERLATAFGGALYKQSIAITSMNH
jgi:hypothetical protein